MEVDCMGYKVTYKKIYFDLAYEVLKKKSNYDDIKAADDLMVIDAILGGANPNIDPWSVDKRLRDEYKTIEMLENIQMNFCYNDGRIMGGIEERIISNLKSDKAGIIADVLLKHTRIKCIDELFVHI